MSHRLVATATLLCLAWIMLRSPEWVPVVVAAVRR